MVNREQRWLPYLAPLLPLAMPVPLGLGVPEDGFPYPWTVCRRLAGEDLAEQRVVDRTTLPSASDDSSPRPATSTQLGGQCRCERSRSAAAMMTSAYTILSLANNGEVEAKR